jgi:hypothetical protein
MRRDLSETFTVRDQSNGCVAFLPGTPTIWNQLIARRVYAIRPVHIEIELCEFPFARISAPPAIGRGRYSSHILTPATTTTYPAIRLAWQMHYLMRWD